MTTSPLRDERGVGMILELVLVAAVLALVGVALYQSNHHVADTDATVAHRPTKITAPAAAEMAAKAAQDDSASEATLSAASETSSNELSAVDTDITSLSESFNDGNF